MTEDLTPAQTKLVNAILEGVEKRVDSKLEEHLTSCSFSSTERKNLHEFLDAIQDEGANRETHIIVLRIGVGVQNAVKRLSTVVAWVLVLVVCWIVVMLVGGYWKIPRMF